MQESISFQDVNKNQVEYTEENVVRTQKNFTAGISGPHGEAPWHPHSTDNRKHAQQGRAFQTV